MAEPFFRKFDESQSGETERFCERHGRYAARRLSAFGKEFLSKCPLCVEEHEGIEAGRGFAKWSEQEKLRFEKANIAPEFWRATLASYDAETCSQKTALGAVTALVKNMRGFVVLSGSFGVGKTHLACAAAKELGGAVYTMFEISARIRSAYSPRAKETELDILKELCALPFLAIDEVGRSKSQEADANWLSHIIGKRCACFLPTMVLSNKKLARELPKERWGESLEAALGDDVAQRIKAGGAIIALEGKNFREAQKWTR